MRNKRNRKPERKFKEVTGKVSMSREGYAFIIVKDSDEDIFVPARKMRGALNGDIVLVTIFGKKSSGRRSSGKSTEGEVIKIIERNKLPFTGILQVAGNKAWVITEGKNMPYDISVPIEEVREIENGLKVAAVVTDWHRNSSEPQGHIVAVLGKPGENDTEMHSILTEYGLPYKFDPKVESAADKIDIEFNSEEMRGRRDFRKVTTMTIDPTDAKDFDDALSLRKIENGKWEIGVHIADVTHFVVPDSIIDKEAYNRGTSVYLVDRTVPMLPEKLSNSLCSLRPNEDKLCFSAVFEINEKGKVLSQWFGRTIINSDMRFDYDAVQKIIEGEGGALREEVMVLHNIASLLRAERFRRGAVSFERAEMKIEVDEKGKPVAIREKVSKEANWLVEEFMLLANRAVAIFVSGGIKDPKKSRTFVYRVHEEPAEDKISAFRDFVKHFGYKMPPVKSGKELSGALNKLLESVKGKPESGAIEIMALRSMARAHYSTDNAGHYGLAFDFYTHFTSPIRRYPDMMVHRLLSEFLEKKKPADKGFYEERCKYASEREQIATEAERASIKYKMVEFMIGKEGQEYDGTISGITEWGMFVEISETKVEGLVPLREIREDFFEFDEKSYTLIGKRTRKTFTLGDPVRIRVERIDMTKKQLDFSLIFTPQSQI